MTAVIERVVFWWRTRRLSAEWSRALAARRATRANRQRAARKGVATKFYRRMEGLKR